MSTYESDTTEEEEAENIRRAEADEEDLRAELLATGAFSAAEVAAMDEAQVLDKLNDLATYRRLA